MKILQFFMAFFLSIFCLTGLAEAQDGKIQSVNVKTLKSWMDTPENVTVIDGGALLACMDAKIPGALCLSCDSENEASLPQKGKMVFYSAYSPLELDCGLIRQASSTGLKEVYVLEGGLAAWRKAGHKVLADKRIPRVAAPAVPAGKLSAWQKSVKDPLVIDIRSPKAFAAKHLDGAMNIPLTRLHLQYADVPLDRPLLVVDEDGHAAFLAASYLARKGFLNVKRLQGGMAACERGVR